MNKKLFFKRRQLRNLLRFFIRSFESIGIRIQWSTAYSTVPHCTQSKAYYCEIPNILISRRFTVYPSCLSLIIRTRLIDSNFDWFVMRHEFPFLCRFCLGEIYFVENENEETKQWVQPSAVYYCLMRIDARRCSSFFTGAVCRCGQHISPSLPVQRQ